MLIGGKLQVKTSHTLAECRTWVPAAADVGIWKDSVPIGCPWKAPFGREKVQEPSLADPPPQELIATPEGEVSEIRIVLPELIDPIESVMVQLSIWPGATLPCWLELPGPEHMAVKARCGGP